MRRHRWILLATAAFLGFLAHAGTFWPPMPMWGWWAHALVGRHAEDWWYSLSEPRDPALYDLATGIAGLVFPVSVALLFLAWVRPLWHRNAGEFPLRWMPLAVFAALNPVYVFIGWGYGIEYQGLTYLLVYIGVNVAALGALAFAFGRLRDGATWRTSLGWHATAAAWILTLAFPWLGETI